MNFWLRKTTLSSFQKFWSLGLIHWGKHWDRVLALEADRFYRNFVINEYVFLYLPEHLCLKLVYFFFKNYIKSWIKWYWLNLSLLSLSKRYCNYSRSPENVAYFSKYPLLFCTVLVQNMHTFDQTYFFCKSLTKQKEYRQDTSFLYLNCFRV